MEAKAVDNNLYQLYWHKSKYYAAVGKYEAKIRLNDVVYDKITLNANDTIFDLAKANFFDEVGFFMSLVPAKPNSFLSTR